jgi:catechol 2,3-dioxygenase-like lactoylglutathione lyase family enzyme
MLVESCIPIVPSADLDRSLRFWVEGLGLSLDRPMRHEGRLVGCIVRNERVQFWLNQRSGTQVKPDDFEGLRLYWAPRDIHSLRERLTSLGFRASEIADREYGQTEFFVTDADGYTHCFGVATERTSA